MSRQVLVLALMLGALNCGSACAQTTPSQLMRAANPTIPAGYRVTWTFKVEMVSANKSDADRCIKILTANHMIPSMSVTTSNKSPEPVFTVVGTREFAAPSEEPDATLEQLRKARLAGQQNLTWSMSEGAVAQSR